MAENNETDSGMADEPVIVTRVFDAPVALVWDACTKPEQLKHWWGPRDYTVPFCTIDLREGGKYVLCLRSPEGQDAWSTGTYREIVPHKRLVCTDSFADENGNVVPASHYGTPGEWPLELLLTMTFEEVDSKTSLTLRHDGLPVNLDRAMFQACWNESFDKMEESFT